MKLIVLLFFYMSIDIFLFFLIWLPLRRRIIRLRIKAKVKEHIFCPWISTLFLLWQFFFHLSSKLNTIWLLFFQHWIFILILFFFRNLQKLFLISSFSIFLSIHLSSDIILNLFERNSNSNFRKFNFLWVIK